MSTSTDVSFYSRNGLWLRPLLAAFILAVAPLIIMTVAPEHAQILMWVSYFGVFLGCAVAGVGVVLTDTLTARLLASAVFIGAVVIILKVMFAAPGNVANIIIALLVVALVLMSRKRHGKA